MNPYNVCDSLNFPLASPAEQNVRICCEISQHLQEGLSAHFVKTFIVPRWLLLLLLYTNYLLNISMLALRLTQHATVMLVFSLEPCCASLQQSLLYDILQIYKYGCRSWLYLMDILVFSLFDEAAGNPTTCQQLFMWGTMAAASCSRNTLSPCKQLFNTEHTAWDVSLTSLKIKD